ncbi:MAG: aspartate aminotransferase family protein [Alphaproteobacteria bacterium]|nr:aspartate aminotransferase family protein [Alphaproteobacteria bacterium]
MISPVMPTYGRFDLAFERGEGTCLFTAQGERYIDFACGIAVTNLGHAHPHLEDAVKDQADKLWHTSNLYSIPGQQTLARRLVENSFADTVFLCNSGAEAVEGAIKTAKRYHYVNGAPERYRIITLENAFHGRTLGTIAAGNNPKHLEGFGPPMVGFDHVPAGNINALEAAITPETAAILLEPVQGEGGVNLVPEEYLKAARQLADEAGILLIYDEVQCGLGRTGTLFCYEHSGVAPDVMAIAKGLGNGFPVGAFLATEEAAKGMTPGTHGSTFGGNPMACAAANAVLDVMLEPSFFDEVNAKAGYLNQKLSALVAGHPDILEGMKGMGLMRGLKCKVTNTDLVAKLLGEHLLTVGAGQNVVRILPPLTVSEAEIDEAMDALERACVALEADAAGGDSA